MAGPATVPAPCSRLIAPGSAPRFPRASAAPELDSLNRRSRIAERSSTRSPVVDPPIDSHSSRQLVDVPAPTGVVPTFWSGTRRSQRWPRLRPQQRKADNAWETEDSTSERVPLERCFPQRREAPVFNAVVLGELVAGVADLRRVQGNHPPLRRRRRRDRARGALSARRSRAHTRYANRRCPPPGVGT